MILNRRTFFVMTSAILATGCATLLPMQQSESASIVGTVFSRVNGLKFSAITSESQPEAMSFTVPNIPVTLTRVREVGESIVIAKVMTNAQGQFEFKHVPGGVYIIQPVGAEAKVVPINTPHTHYLGFFQRFQVR